mmetsp:Transcript_25641/g.56484  ORF Transcript_25641/g.56484 Transcript_25641/m.56484 type:complete len:310 (-) Transcript_25641:688-1617(-)
MMQIGNLRRLIHNMVPHSLHVQQATHMLLSPQGDNQTILQRAFDISCVHLVDHHLIHSLRNHLPLTERLQHGWFYANQGPGSFGKRKICHAVDNQTLGVGHTLLILHQRCANCVGLANIIGEMECGDEPSPCLAVSALCRYSDTIVKHFCALCNRYHLASLYAGRVTRHWLSSRQDVQRQIHPALRSIDRCDSDGDRMPHLKLLTMFREFPLRDHPRNVSEKSHKHVVRSDSSDTTSHRPVDVRCIFKRRNHRGLVQKTALCGAESQSRRLINMQDSNLHHLVDGKSLRNRLGRDICQIVHLNDPLSNI